MGPPGAGKGTQSALLGQRLRLASISTGHILREEVRRKSPLGLETKRYMDKGDLVPDDVIMRILEERLRQPDCQPGFILDGVPRTLPQGDDDHEDIIASRLEVYVRATAPLLQHYRARNLLAEVDGVGSRDDILGRILERVAEQRA